MICTAIRTRCCNCSASGTWSGRKATLWLLGDYVDHGPDGVGVIDILIRLQAEATRAGGRVIALLGNHDLMLLAAQRFGDEPRPGGGSYLSTWRDSQGMQRDLELLSPARARWLRGLPLIARLDTVVLVHADAAFYAGYSTTGEAIDGRLRAIVQSDDRDAWEALLTGIDRHRAFIGADGAQRAAAFVESLGTHMLMHGHTPIAKVTGQNPATVRVPYRYADGRCLNIDGGIYLGGAGIICPLP